MGTESTPPAAAIKTMLDNTIVWANANKKVDPKKPLTKEDVAYVSLTQIEFNVIPSEPFWDSWVQAYFKQYDGVLYRFYTYNMPEITGPEVFVRRIAWRYTGNTAKMINWEHHKVKESDD